MRLEELLDERGLHAGRLLQHPRLAKVYAVAAQLLRGDGERDGLGAVQLRAPARLDDALALQLDHRGLSDAGLGTGVLYFRSVTLRFYIGLSIWNFREKFHQTIRID